MAFIYLFHFNSFLIANLKKLKKKVEKIAGLELMTLGALATRLVCTTTIMIYDSLFRPIGLEQKFVKFFLMNI